MVGIIYLRASMISLLFLCMTSCNSQPQNITIKDNPMSWQTTTLPSETGSPSFDYDFEQYLVIDSLTGFMIGNNTGAITHQRTLQQLDNQPKIGLYENIQTVILKTKDGGLSFQKSTLGKGSLEKIVSDTQKNLYIIKTTYEADAASTQKYSILKSNDLGISWKTISDFKTHKIKNIRFYDSNNGIVCVKEGKNKYQLLKTVNGGKTWNIFALSNPDLSVLGMRFITKNKLYTSTRNKDKVQMATVHFDTGEVKIYDCDLPDEHRFSSYFNDGDTLYSEVYKYKSKDPRQLMLYNHTTKKLTKYNFMIGPEELSLGVTKSENYIGVLRQDKGKTYYFYSNNNGKNWKKEELPDPLTSGHPVAIYGKGLVWVRNAVRNLYDVQVRKPDIF